MPLFLGKYIWLALGIVFGVVEATTTSLVSIWFVFGAVAAFITSFITGSFFIQAVVFAVVSIVCLIYTKPIADKSFFKKIESTNADRVIGNQAIVRKDIAPNSPGRVKADGLSWLAHSQSVLKTGDVCIVDKIEGASVTVSPVKISTNN